jgi:predicted permease
LITEALVLASLAGLIGVGLARLTIDAGLRVFFATTTPEFAKLVRLHSLEPDYRVFLFALAAAAVCAVGAALIPALQATRPDTLTAVRGEFSGRFRASRVRDGLVVVQVVVCAVLLVCGALLYRRASVFQAMDTGMRYRGVVNVSGPGSDAISSVLRSRPDVEAVAVASHTPWMGRLHQTMVIPSGHSSAQSAGYNRVSPAYFQVFGIALRSGRLFTEAEARANAPVAIISEATARTFWPGDDPIGKTFRPTTTRERHLDNLPTSGEITVIGVARDVIHGPVFLGKDRTCLYLPVSETNASGMQTLALFRVDEETGLHRLRQWIMERRPTFEGETLPMSTVFGVQIYPLRAAAWIGWLLGAVAMALSVSGMYGVMSYLVNQRSKEIGIRVALGATPAKVMSMVMRRSFLLAGIGAAVGALFAGGAVKLLLLWSSGYVFGCDSVALLSGTTLAGAVAVLAAIGPSFHAARIDPNRVLRAE